MDPARWLCEVCGGQVLARGPAVAAAAARALEAGTLACAAQLLGAGRALLEASVRHARQRAQFGQPIGSFQAVKHQLADVAIGLEFARPLLDAAAAALDDQARRARGADPEQVHSARDVSAAKVACTDAAYRAARAALQVHGAIGYTQEHDLQPVADQGPRAGRGLGQPGGAPRPGHGRHCAGAGGMELTSEQRELRDAVRGLLARQQRPAGEGSRPVAVAAAVRRDRRRPGWPSPNATAGPGPARPRCTW